MKIHPVVQHLGGTVTVALQASFVGDITDTTDKQRIGAYGDPLVNLGGTFVHAPIAAEGTLTLRYLPIVGESFIVDGQTFNWVASGSAVGEVVIGTNMVSCCDNIVTSINRDLVSVTAHRTNNTVVVTSVALGSGMNSLLFSESTVGESMDGNGHLGGTQAGADAVSAQGTITMSGLPVADQTFMVGTQTFIWAASYTTPGQVVIGATPAEHATNIAAAITTLNNGVVTATVPGAAPTTVLIQAVAAGTAGNSIVLSAGNSNGLAVNGSYLGITRSGQAAIAAIGTITMSGVPNATETFVVDTQMFTWVASGTATGNVVVGADASECCTNVVTSITRDLSTVTAVKTSSTAVVVAAVAPGAGGNAIVFTSDSPSVLMDGSSALGGTRAGTVGQTFQTGALEVYKGVTTQMSATPVRFMTQLPLGSPGLGPTEAIVADPVTSATIWSEIMTDRIAAVMTDLRTKTPAQLVALSDSTV